MSDKFDNYKIPCEEDYADFLELGDYGIYRDLPDGRYAKLQYLCIDATVDDVTESIVLSPEKVDELITVLLYWKKVHGYE